MGITTIIVDFGKVLLDYDFQRFYATLRNDCACTDEVFEEFFQVSQNEEVCSSFDREDIPFSDNIRLQQTLHPACAPLFEAFDKRFQEVVTGEVPGMRKVLQSLKNNGYQLLGLSNWSSKVYETMRIFPEMFSLLDGRVLSCEEHLLKPEPEIYQRLLSRFSLSADECVFIDDKQVNVDGSKAVGIDAILFRGADNLQEELRKRGYMVV